MAEDNESEVAQTTRKKKMSISESENDPPRKKIKVKFSGKEFRKQIQTPQNTEALQHFLQLIKEPNCDHVLLYLEKGGNPLEIIQVMENDPSVSPVLILDIVNQILLQINAKHQKFKNSAYDACRYLLNSYVTLINKMLSLSSSTKERVVTLKLLTTISTFSTLLAKDVLLHVNFNPTNLELLTKVSEGKNEVRNAFVHFIIAFLVDGHFPTLSVLLEKRGLLTSIISGLKYDGADAVVLILTAMKNHILENQFVSKTIKMKTFSTPVVKDIVNLYNWKGLGGIPDPKKKTKLAMVDDVEKSRVNESVHNFLLVLCTSHKFGVIFKDASMGLTKKNYNSLMYTVLESLERPWEHSYAGELVIKICGACPDLAKTVWINLKPFLVPRLTTKWLNAMKFASKLLDELQPQCIDFCIKELQIHQVSQIISILVLPLPILKAIIPENELYEKQTTKLHVLKLLTKMLDMTLIFVAQIPIWGLDHANIVQFLSNHISRNFLNAKSILSGWENTDLQSEQGITVSSRTDYLEAAIDLLDLYKTLAPQLLDTMSPVFDIQDLLVKKESLEDTENLRNIQVKAIKLFFDLEPALFSPKTELFQTVFLLVFEFYYTNQDSISMNVLKNLLKNSNVFDGFAIEIPIWIDGVLNLKKYDQSVPLFISNVLKSANENASIMHRKLFELKNANFSPMILALIDYLQENEATKYIKSYLNFVFLTLLHLQLDSTSFRCLISNLNFLSSGFVDYIDNWGNFQATHLNKCKGRILDKFQDFSINFSENNIDTIETELYIDYKLNLLQAAVFYLTNLIKGKSINEKHFANCEKLIDILIDNSAFHDERYIKTVFEHPLILNNFSVFATENLCSKFILNVVKKLKDYKLDSYLVDYRNKIVSTLVKAFKHPLKYESSEVMLDILDVFELDYEHCLKLVKTFINSQDNKSFFRVISYCLNRIASLAEKDYGLEPLDGEVIKILSNTFIHLIKEQIANSHYFSEALLNYLKVFPHNTEDVVADLFEKLILMPEFNKDNLSLSEFLLERKPETIDIFETNLEIVCSKRSFILALLDVLVAQNNEDILKRVFDKFQVHIIKALQKPHKTGQQFQNYYKSVGFLIEQFMQPDNFGKQIQKFETTEFFHVSLLKKVFDKVAKNDKVLHNMIMTFVHLLINAFKQKGNNKNVENFDETCVVFLDFLGEIENKPNLTNLNYNEAFKLFCKFCLKYGVGENAVLLKIVAVLVELCLEEDDAKLVLEMFLSHSRFLDVVLGENKKNELLNLWLVLCTKFEQFMERSHVPILLAAYKASRKECDLTILTLLKMYECKADQTHFYEFKPFLWGRSAASYYSVRSDIQKVLWRQPRMADVLDNLNESTVQATITNPLSPDVYDLDFLLPLFNHLLAPEAVVQTYRFTKCGALALTVTGLRGEKSQRLAACQVLSRFYFHLEAKRTGKDHLLWIRFVEAICKEMAVLEDCKLNNFAAIFLAKSALVLTQPGDVMYVPLSQYLAAKDSLDFSAIPELYTFLHSSDVNSREHKHFILGVLRHGMKTERDFTVFLKAMGFKLISELCSSTMSDVDTKILILDIYQACCNISFAVKVLCWNLSFLTQIFCLFINHLQSKEILKDNGVIVKKVLEILFEIVKNDSDKHRNFTIFLNLWIIIEDDRHFNLVKSSTNLEMLYKILVHIFNRFPDLCSEEIVERLLSISQDKYSVYLRNNGCKFVKEKDLSTCLDSNYYLRLLFFNKFK